MTTKISTTGRQSMPSSTTDIRPYWKPEPKRLGFSWWTLLVPALIYAVGVVIYAHDAFVPGLHQLNGHRLGSALMVFGGEANSISSAAEVWRKSQVKTGKIKKGVFGEREETEANAFDWVGLLISLVATLGNLFVVYVALTDISASWVGFVREYGPLILILCSGMDFAVNIMEFGFYNASFQERWETWNLGLHNHETAELKRLEELRSKPAQAAFDEKAERAKIKQELADAQQKKALDNLLKDDATRTVYSAISAQPDSSNSQLAEITGYSRTTIANKLDVLRAVGAIR